MAIPVYVVTGFLDAGKTTFLNTLYQKIDWRDLKCLLLQFEIGDEALDLSLGDYDVLSFPKKALEQSTDTIVQRIAESIRSAGYDEIWIEWNGMVPFAALHTLLLNATLKAKCRIQKVINIVDGASFEYLLGRTGEALPEQIANADIAVVRNANTPHAMKKLKGVIKGLNPDIEIYQHEDYETLYMSMFEKSHHPMRNFVVMTLMLTLFFSLGRSLLNAINIPVDKTVNMFLGILLQALPFLIIGVLLSSFIQVFIPQNAIEKHFPKSLGLGMLFAILAGFCLPVCDCASIPIFRSLLKKGTPLPVAVTFMAATPIINPVVIISTYYAFSGNLKVVVARVALGIIVAMSTGLIFALKPLKGDALMGDFSNQTMCRCGCYDGVPSNSTFKQKLGVMMQHAQLEFFDVGRYLLIGTILSAMIQVKGLSLFSGVESGFGLALSILVMMVAAFVISLCSSSDAIIARSLASQFPSGAIMGFLLFGPIMDIKNVLMMSSAFSKRFILRLLVTTFVVCFCLVFGLSMWGGL